MPCSSAVQRFSQAIDEDGTAPGVGYVRIDIQQNMRWFVCVDATHWRTDLVVACHALSS